MKTKPTQNERFAAKVNLSGPVPTHLPELGPCHVWTAATNIGGYGLVRFRGKSELAHRVSFFLSHGRWPEPCALHHCDNPPCVNEAHLFEGTRIDNSNDKVTKGRQSAGATSGPSLHPECMPRGDDHWTRKYPDAIPRGLRHGTKTCPESVANGERHASAKLTEQKVLDIRANYLLCRVTQKELALRYGVSEPLISRLIRGKIWSHVGNCNL